MRPAQAATAEAALTSAVQALVDAQPEAPLPYFARTAAARLTGQHHQRGAEGAGAQSAPQHAPTVPVPSTPRLADEEYLEPHIARLETLIDDALAATPRVANETGMACLDALAAQLLALADQ